MSGSGLPLLDELLPAFTEALMAAEVAYAQAQITEQDALSAYNTALAAMDRVAGAEVVRN